MGNKIGWGAGVEYCEIYDSKQAARLPHSRAPSQSSQEAFSLLWVEKENLTWILKMCDPEEC